MDKQQLIEKTTETLRPFETSNLIETMQHLSIKQVFSHPAVLVMIIVIFFFGLENFKFFIVFHVLFLFHKALHKFRPLDRVSA